MRFWIKGIKRKSKGRKDRDGAQHRVSCNLLGQFLHRHGPLNALRGLQCFNGYQKKTLAILPRGSEALFGVS